MVEFLTSVKLLKQKLKSCVISNHIIKNIKSFFDQIRVSENKIKLYLNTGCPVCKIDNLLSRRT